MMITTAKGSYETAENGKLPHEIVTKAIQNNDYEILQHGSRWLIDSSFRAGRFIDCDKKMQQLLEMNQDSCMESI